jgi:O-antigen/teichoic acid export membrane protein
VRLQISRFIHGAGGAVGAQASQALASFLLMAVAARALDIDNLGKLAVLYSTIVLCTAVTSGFIGDSLTVLDRHDRSIRSALQWLLVLLALAAGAAAAAVTAVTGFIALADAFLLAAAVMCYLVEDIMRRLLMANIAFLRLICVDLVSLVISMAVLWLWSRGGQLELGTFLAAIAIGQLAAAVAAMLLTPVEDRYFSAGRPGGWTGVARFGVWRAAQQTLRPALLTALRLAIVAAIGLAAAGELEIARLYAAPAMLFVSGMSSYLFASFARKRDVPVAELLRQADRGVLILLAATAVVAVVGLPLLPIAGPLMTGSVPEVMATAGWLAYAASIAAVTPYGALAAVRGQPRWIFAIRLLDSLLSLLAAGTAVAVTGNPAYAPIVAAVGSALGGWGIRRILLVPLVRNFRQQSGSPSHERQSGTHV